MCKKIKIKIPGFGERYCSGNTEYKISSSGDSYKFFKKGTNIKHNEYGPAIEYYNGNFIYYINDKYHRLSGNSSDYDSKLKLYDVIGKCIGETKKEFIKNLANALIPNKY